jgi:hypothetical protein
MDTDRKPICPLLKEQCKEDKCAWLDSSHNQCGIASTAEEIPLIATGIS